MTPRPLLALPVGLLVLLLVAGAGPGRSGGELAALLEPIRRELGVPALAGAIVHGGELISLGAVGRRSAQEEELVDLDDQWHLGSCTKAMTASVLARLVEEGELAWSTTVGDVFDTTGLDSAYAAVTLEMLLAHRSGLPDDRQPTAEFFWKLMRMSEPLHEQRLELLHLVMAAPPIFPPGARTQYSNHGYVIAAAMAEEVTGEAWEGLVRRLVFEPLGMRSAGFGAPGDTEAIDQPRGHWEGLAMEPGARADNPRVLRPAGGVHATLADWSKFIAWQLDGARGDARLLEESSFQKLRSPVAGGPYGLGWLVTERDWAGGLTLTHTGTNTMWFCAVWMSPARDFAVLTACNTGGDRGSQACDRAAWSLIRHYLDERDD